MLRQTVVLCLVLSLSACNIAHFHYHFQHDSNSQAYTSFVTETSYILNKKIDPNQAETIVQTCIDASKGSIADYFNCLAIAPVSDYVCAVIYKLYLKADPTAEQISTRQIVDHCKQRSAQ